MSEAEAKKEIPAEEEEVNKTLQYGKYIHKKIEDVAKIDKEYLEWLVQQPYFKNKDEVKKYL